MSLTIKKIAGCFATPWKCLFIILAAYETLTLLLSTNAILAQFGKTVVHEEHGVFYRADIRNKFYFEGRNAVPKDQENLDEKSLYKMNITLGGEQNLNNTKQMTNVTKVISDSSKLKVNTTHVKKTVHRRHTQSTSSKYKSYVLTSCKAEERSAKRLPGTSKPLCPCFPPNLRGRIMPNITSLMTMNWPQARSIINNTNPGGHWKPAHCTPRRRVAVIIPCRDRELHLRAFVTHTHPILQSQLIEYTIFVVEQELPYTFNKGSMMNIGFLEAVKSFQPDCVLFHDVDLLMENDKHLVVCGQKVQHMGAFIDKLHYRIKYTTLLGGAVLLKADTFKHLNGFSNKFFGWGGEDDDFEHRLHWQNLTMFRAPRDIASYSMIKHDKDVANPRARDRGKYRRFSQQMYNTDGINSVKYKVLKRVQYPLYTWIHARLIRTKYSARHFSNIKSDFTVVRAACTDHDVIDTVVNKYYLSVTTCRSMCLRQRQTPCAGLVYVRSDVMDSYCQFLHSKCTTMVPSNSTELHVRRKF